MLYHFQIKLVEKGSNPFEATSKIIGEAKKIHKLCNGNYLMYVRRRKPDSLEVQQMKVTYKPVLMIFSFQLLSDRVSANFHNL